MAFALSPEQQEFRDTLRRFLEDASPASEVRRVMETHEGYDPSVWRSMAADLGLPGVMITESDGGQGFGFEELTVVQEELGRSLVPCPFLGSVVLAGRLIEHVTSGDARSELLRGIASGEIASLAWAEKGGFTPASIRCRAVGSQPTGRGAGFRLRGHKTYVLDGHLASLLLVVARDDDGALGVFRVDPEVEGVVRRRLKTVDRTRRLAEVRLEAAPAVRLAHDVEAGLERMLVEANVALCAESVGGMERVLETAVAYARERKQFGRSIGSFQAIKHKLADLWILFEGARTATREATLALAGQREDAALLASIARAHTADAYRQASFDNIQVHGGVGFTWEYDAHLYLRRAQFAAQFLGTASDHREAVAQWLGARDRQMNEAFADAP